MKIVSLIFQLIIAIGLFNVWLLRFHKKTAYRAGSAISMREEFTAYGLPSWSLWMVGGLKISCAICLVVGIWLPVLVKPAAAVIATLMVGAILMHLKVRDPWMKSLPASIVLLLTAVVLANA
jgi:uncharacterized membrane protein YphA (DoxX/SURF4 family)